MSDQSNEKIRPYGPIFALKSWQLLFLDRCPKHRLFLSVLNHCVFKTEDVLQNAGCIPSAVVIMTTADRMHPAFSGWHLKLFF